MTLVQLFNRQQRAFTDFSAINRIHMEAYKDNILCYALYYPAVELLSSVAIALIIWEGGGGVLRGTVLLGTLVGFMQYAQRFFRPIQDLSEKYNILQAAMAASERIFKLLDTPPEIVSPGIQKRAMARADRVSRVWFTYQRLDSATKSKIATANTAETPGHERCRLGDARRLLRGRTQPDCRDRRPHRGREDHHYQPDDALLRCAARPGADRWR